MKLDPTVAKERNRTVEPQKVRFLSLTYLARWSIALLWFEIRVCQGQVVHSTVVIRCTTILPWPPFTVGLERVGSCVSIFVRGGGLLYRPHSTTRQDLRFRSTKPPALALQSCVVHSAGSSLVRLYSSSFSKVPASLRNSFKVSFVHSFL